MLNDPLALATVLSLLVGIVSFAINRQRSARTTNWQTTMETQIDDVIAMQKNTVIVGTALQWNTDTQCFLYPIRNYLLRSWIVKAKPGCRTIVWVESKHHRPALLVLRSGDVLRGIKARHPASDEQHAYEVQCIMPDSGQVIVFAGSRKRLSDSLRMEVKLDMPSADDDKPLPIPTNCSISRSPHVTLLRRFVDIAQVESDRSASHCVDVWTVTAKAGSHVIVRAKSNAISATICLTSTTTTVVERQDWRSIILTMPESGQAKIYAEYRESSSTASYRLSAEYRWPIDPVGILSLDDKECCSMRFVLDDNFVDPISGHFVDRWLVQAEPGRCIVLRVHSHSFQPTLDLLCNAIGTTNTWEPVIKTTDTWEPHREQKYYWDNWHGMAFVMPDSGEVDVLLESTATGGYGIRADYRWSSEQKRMLSLLTVMDGSRRTVGSGIIDEKSFVDPLTGHSMERWLVKAAPHSYVVVQAESTDFEPVLDSGLCQATSDRLEIAVPKSGQVTVYVGSRDTESKSVFGSMTLYGLTAEYSWPRPHWRRLNLIDSNSDVTHGKIVEDCRHKLWNTPVEWRMVEAEPGRRVVVRASSDDFQVGLEAFSGTDNITTGQIVYRKYFTLMEFDVPDSGVMDVLVTSPDMSAPYRIEAEYRWPKNAKETVWVRDDEHALAKRYAIGRRGWLKRRERANSGQHGWKRGTIDDRSWVDPVLGRGVEKWVITAKPGSRLACRIESDAFGPVLYLYDGIDVLESRIVAERGTLGVHASVFEVTMPASGRTCIIAGARTSDEKGEYWLCVDRLYDVLLEYAYKKKNIVGTLTLGEQPGDKETGVAIVRRSTVLSEGPGVGGAGMPHPDA